MITSTNDINVEYYQDLFEEVTDILSNFVKNYIDEKSSVVDDNKVVTDIKIKSTTDKKYCRYEFGEMKEVDFTTPNGKQIAKDLYQAYLDVEKEVNSLEDYFGIIKTITDCIDTNYQILPLIARNGVFINAEEPFEIDANTRAIKIPPNNYTYAVSGDNLAETIYFSIDRYFDNEDLNTHNIAVLSSINGKKIQTPIEVKDITSVPNKIIFGWPIGKIITKQTSGTLEFSIRFYTVKGTKVDYSFNTLPAHITIKNSLDFLSDAATDYENGDEIIVDQSARFARELLQNGDIYKTAAIQTPVFYYETSYPENGDYGITDTSPASLSAAAYSPDALDVEYEWVKANKAEGEDLTYENEYIYIGTTITEQDIAKYQIFYYQDKSSGEYRRDLITAPITNGDKEYYRLGSTITKITGPGSYQCIAKAKRSDIRYKVGKSSVFKIPEPSTFDIKLKSGLKESDLIYRFGKDENDDSAKDFLNGITENVMDEKDLKANISLNLSGPDDNIYTFSKTNTLNNDSVDSNGFKVTIYNAMPSDLNDSIEYTCSSSNETYDTIKINCNKYDNNTMNYSLSVSSPGHVPDGILSLDQPIQIFKGTQYIINLTITSRYPSFNRYYEESTGLVNIPATGRYN